MRFATQWGDGLFQAALGGAVLFNPEREADPLAVAAGLAVMLIPYSVIGPFAGALLDRWDRRQVLLVASLLRAERGNYAKQPEQAARLTSVGVMPAEKRLRRDELAAFTTVASTILNLDEAITKE